MLVSRNWAGWLAPSVALACVSTLAAQTMAPPHHWERVSVSSGVRVNPLPVEVVVWSDFVMLPQGTPWLRLNYHAVNLDKGSYLRITSVLDGAIMTQHAEHLPQWGNTSCYFNGNAVMVELVAGPDTTNNFIDIARVQAGDIDASQEPETICGSTDNRVPSTDVRAGRIDPIGCTGWIINQPSGNDKLHLSAGHCFGSGQVLEFDVPASNANCSLVHPPPAKQFAIDSASSQSVNGGIGNDYWVFRCFPNSTTGLTTFQEQGSSFTLAAALPGTGSTLRNTGYGLDGTSANNASGGNNSCTCSSGAGTGTRNQTQQTHTGPLFGTSGDAVRYQIDTCGGNSGSPVINESNGQAIAIHTNGGCTTSTSSYNSGTSVLKAALQTAIANVGIPGPSNDFCINSIAIGVGTNGPFNNVASSLSPPAWSCGGSNPGRDVWFSFDANCSGSHTFRTCTPTRNFDTVIELFSSCSSAATPIACNDDACDGLGSSITVSLTPGIYYLRVGGYNQASGNFDVVVQRPEIYDAGPLVTDPTGGSGGAPLSMLQTGLSTFGYTANASFNLADDFATNGLWCVSAIECFVYQTNSSTPSINGVFLEVYNGDPRFGGTPVAGSPGFANNLVTTAGYTVTNTMTGIYRALESDPTSTARPIQSVLVGLANPLNLNSATIPGGRYFLRMSFTGTSASGPFVPPITILDSPVTGDAIQNTVSTGTWTAITNGTGNGQGLPFVLYGTTSSLPGAFINLGGGCSPATLQMRGAPHVGGVVHAEITNLNPGAIPLVIIGFSNPNAPFAPACGCVLHAALDVLNFGSSYNWQVPMVPSAVGFELYFQGDQIFNPGLACDIGIGFRFELTNGYRVRLY